MNKQEKQHQKIEGLRKVRDAYVKALSSGIQNQYNRLSYSVVLKSIQIIQLLSLIFCQSVTNQLVQSDHFFIFFLNSLKAFRLFPIYDFVTVNSDIVFHRCSKNPSLLVIITSLLINFFLGIYLIIMVILNAFDIQSSFKKRNYCSLFRTNAGLLFRNLWHAYNYVLLIPFLKENVDHIVCNDNLKLGNVVAIASTIAIALIINYHDFEYKFENTNCLQRRDGTYNLLFIIQVIIIACISQIEDSNISLVIHLLLVLLLMSFLRFGSTYYNSTIDIIEISGILLRLILLVITISFYNVREHSVEELQMIEEQFGHLNVLYTTHQQPNITVIYLVLGPLIVKMAIQVRHCIISNYIIQQQFAECKDPRVIDLKIRYTLQQMNLWSVGSFIDKPHGIIFNSIKGEHITQCISSQCFCREFEKEQATLTDWQQINNKEKRSSFIYQLIKLQFEESLKQKNMVSSSFLKQSYLVFLIEIFNNPVKAYCELMLAKLELSKKGSIKDQVYLQIILEEANAHFQFFLKQQKQLKLKNVIEFDEKIEIFNESMKECIKLEDQMNNYLVRDLMDLEELSTINQKIQKMQRSLLRKSQSLFKLNWRSQRLKKLFSIYMMLFDTEDLTYEQMVLCYRDSCEIEQGQQVENTLKSIDIFSKESCVVIISLQKPIGLIIKVNNNFQIFFEHKKEDVINKNCSILMPQSSAKLHDGILMKYIDRLDLLNTYNVNDMRQIFGVTKSNYVIRLQISTRSTQIQEDQFGVLGYLQVIEDGDYILFEKSGRMSYSTKSLCNDLFQDTEDLCLENSNFYLNGFNIQVFIPIINIMFDLEKSYNEFFSALLIMPTNPSSFKMFVKFERRQDIKKIFNKLNFIDFNYYFTYCKLGKEKIDSENNQLYVKIQRYKVIDDFEIVNKELASIIEQLNEKLNLQIKTLDLYQQTALLGTSLTMTTINKQSEDEKSIYMFRQTQQQLQNYLFSCLLKQSNDDRQQVLAEAEHNAAATRQPKKNKQKRSLLMMDSNQFENQSMEQRILFQKIKTIDFNQQASLNEDIPADKDTQFWKLAEPHSLSLKPSTYLYNQNLESNENQFMESIKRNFNKTNQFSLVDNTVSPINMQLLNPPKNTLAQQADYETKILTSSQAAIQFSLNNSSVQLVKHNLAESQQLLLEEARGIEQHLPNDQTAQVGIPMENNQAQEIQSPIRRFSEYNKYCTRKFETNEMMLPKNEVEESYEDDSKHDDMKTKFRQKQNILVQMKQQESKIDNNHKQSAVVRSLKTVKQINIIRELEYISIFSIALLFLINIVIYSLILQGWDNQLYLMQHLTVSMKSRIIYSILIKQRSIIDLTNLNAFQLDLQMRQHLIQLSQLSINEKLQEYVIKINDIVSESPQVLEFANYLRNDTVQAKFSNIKGQIYMTKAMQRNYYLLFMIQTMKNFAFLNDPASKTMITENFAIITGVLTDCFDINYNQTLNQYNDIKILQQNILIAICTVSLTLISLLFPIYYVIQNNRETILRLFTTVSQNSIQKKSQMLQICYSKCSHQQTLKTVYDRKKRSINQCSKLKKIDYKLLVICLLSYTLICVYPLINYILVSTNIDNGKLNAEGLYNLYWPMAQMTSNYAANYNSIMYKLNTGTLPTVNQNRIAQLQVLNKHELKRLSVMLNNFHHKRYNQELFETIIEKIFTSDICTSVQNNQQHIKIQDFYYEECTALSSGLLKKGLIITITQMYDFFEQLFTLYSLDLKQFQKKIIEWEREHKLVEMEKLFNIVINLMDSINGFLNTQNEEYLIYIKNIQLWLFIYSVLSLILIFIIWQLLYNKWANSFIQTRESLKLLPLLSILENSYIMTYLLKEYNNEQ